MASYASSYINVRRINEDELIGNVVSILKNNKSLHSGESGFETCVIMIGDNVEEYSGFADYENSKVNYRILGDLFEYRWELEQSKELNEIEQKAINVMEEEKRKQEETDKIARRLKIEADEKALREKVLKKKTDEKALYERLKETYGT